MQGHTAAVGCPTRRLGFTIAHHRTERTGLALASQCLRGFPSLPGNMPVAVSVPGSGSPCHHALPLRPLLVANASVRATSTLTSGSASNTASTTAFPASIFASLCPNRHPVRPMGPSASLAPSRSLATAVHASAVPSLASGSYSTAAAACYTPAASASAPVAAGTPASSPQQQACTQDTSQAGAGRRRQQRPAAVVLGIESSCDDTGVAVVTSEGRVLGEAIATQADVHAPWGGVVPTLARDAHAAAIDRTVAAALAAAGLQPQQLSAIAVTQGPGLGLCLRVGVSKARDLARKYGIPLVSVHHMEAHALVARLPPAAAEAAAPAVRLAAATAPDQPSSSSTSEPQQMVLRLLEQPQQDAVQQQQQQQQQQLAQRQEEQESQQRQLSEACQQEQQDGGLSQTAELVHQQEQQQQQQQPCLPAHQGHQQQATPNQNTATETPSSFQSNGVNSSTNSSSSIPNTVNSSAVQAHAVVRPNSAAVQVDAAAVLGDVGAATAGLPFPFLCLLVSGGHNLLVLVRGVGSYVQLGTTLDDALGEAYDKVARLMELELRPHGGAALEALARDGDPKAYNFPVPMRKHATCDFSFAGLKTSTRLAIERELAPPASQHLTPQQLHQVRANIAASFQSVAVRHLLDRTRRGVAWARELLTAEHTRQQQQQQQQAGQPQQQAGQEQAEQQPQQPELHQQLEQPQAEHQQPQQPQAEQQPQQQAAPRQLGHLVVAGGVACNRVVRDSLQQLADAEGLQLVLPPTRWCTDNGVMVAWAGMERLARGWAEPPPPPLPLPLPRQAPSATPTACEDGAASAEAGTASTEPAAGSGAPVSDLAAATVAAAAIAAVREAEEEWIELKPRWPLTSELHPRSAAAQGEQRRSMKKVRLAVPLSDLA
ncbi:hypothetical protein Agub_g3356, partial [Astrephomene gubernaculifera]